MTFPRNLLLFALPALLIVATPTWAADTLFGTNSPLLKFTEFITGPFAYAVVIIALVVTVGVLAIGGEFSGFSRRMPIIVIAGGIVILSGKVLKNLFGADAAADLPEFIQTPPALWSEPAPLERVAFDRFPSKWNTQHHQTSEAVHPALSNEFNKTRYTLDTGLSNTGLSDFSDALRPQPDLFRLEQPDGDDQP